MWAHGEEESRLMSNSVQRSPACSRHNCYVLCIEVFESKKHETGMQALISLISVISRK